MKKNLKRMFSLVMALCMALTLMVPAFAAVPEAPAIPGYTLLTEMPEGGLDTSKYYLIVTQDSDSNLYALYINQAGTGVGPGSLTGANGACTATLTVNEDSTVTAAYLNGGASLDVNDLRITVNNSGTDYTFRSGDYGLSLGSKMFSTDYTALSVSVAEGLWTIKNTTSGRLLSFNQNGNTTQSQYPNHITDFWGPNKGKVDSFPIYLYVQDDAIVPVDKGALNAAIAETEGLREAEYTPESWSALQTALTEAQGVAADESATQAEVNSACAALESALDALVRQLTPPDDLPTAIAYLQDTDGVDSGAVYAIYTNASVAANNRILYHTGTGKTDKVQGSVSGNELTLTGGKFADSTQLWTITAVEGGYTVRSVDSGRYLDLSQASSANLATSDQPVVLTIGFDEETGLYTIYKQDGYALNFDNSEAGVFSTTSVENAYGLRFFKQSEVPAETVDREELIPQPGTTQGEPFAPGTGGSNNFRIPSIITLNSGRILAAIDARWNHLGDACALDTILSYSDDGGQTWHYSFPNYFEDSVNAYQANATAFIDPVMVQGNDGTIYLMVDLFPGGVALNTAPMAPARSSGYVEIDGVQRLALYLTAINTEQTDSNYACYVGDFANGYAQVYDATTHGPTGYYVDDHYYLYYNKEATQNPEQDKIYCQQLGSSKFVQQNLFFYNADLHVRCATYLWLLTSTDGGETWSAPTILNPQIRTGADQFYGVGPGAGLCLEDGTIMLPAYTFTSGIANSNQIASFIYSSDGGKTWSRSDDATGSGHWSSESCLVQIDETTVRHFYRDGYSTLYYTDHTWNGEAWVAGDPVDTGVHKTYNNQLSAIKYSQQVDGKDVILVSTAAGNANSRTNGKIYTFVVNEDKTMELINTYEVTASGVAYGYSSLTETADGSVALLYEGASSRSVFTVIPADELGIPVETSGGGTGGNGSTGGGTVIPGGDVDIDDPDTPLTELPFVDVAADAWYAQAVAYVNEAGLMTGTGSTTFSPDIHTTRAMVATILYRVAGSPALEEENLGYPYADVVADSWYGPAVYWARLHQVVNGVGNNLFDPHSPVTREQLVTMLYRYAGQPAVTGDTSAFTDSDDVSDWAADAMAWAIESGIIAGMGNNTLAPQGFATRAQVATIFMRFLPMMG